MELAYETKKLRQLCLGRSMAEQEFGREVAQFLHARIADLRAVDSVEELLIGNKVIGGAGAEQQLTISFSNGLSIVLAANHASFDTDYEMNWLKVRRVKIVEVGHSNG